MPYNSKFCQHTIFIIILGLMNLLSFIHNFTIYSPLRTYSQKLFLVANNGIYLSNDKMEQLSKIKTFDEEYNLFLEYSYILVRQYEQGDGYIFIKRKGDLYIYLEDQLICESTLNEYSQLTVDIILNNYEKISDSNYIFYYITAVVNNQYKIIIEQRKLVYSNSLCENIIIKQSSTIKNSQNQETTCQSQIITCQRLYSRKLKKDILTCFCQLIYPYYFFFFH